MKSIVLVALALVAVASAGPIEFVEILRSDYQKDPEGSYAFNYAASNGNAREEVGSLKQVFDEDKKPHDVIVVKGSYSYTDLESGQPIEIHYDADEFGYRAFGDSIPKTARK